MAELDNDDFIVFSLICASPIPVGIIYEFYRYGLNPPLEFTEKLSLIVFDVFKMGLGVWGILDMLVNHGNGLPYISVAYIGCAAIGCFLTYSAMKDEFE